MSGFEFEYTLWVFLSTIGIFQYTALKNNLWGFVVLRNMPSITKILSILIIISSFLWFFLSEDRNVPDTTEGIDGVVQTRWFAIGAISAIAMLTFIASITKANRILIINPLTNAICTISLLFGVRGNV